MTTTGRVLGEAFHSSSAKAITLDTDRPRVLVLIATYNGEKWIRAQLNSILTQESVDVSILARDDCSGDSTGDILECIASHNDNLEVYRSQRRSGSAAANFFNLIESARLDSYEFVALSDQDDHWFPDKLSRAVNMLRNSHACGYSSATKAIWPNGRQKKIAINSKQTSSDYFFQGGGQGCTFVINSGEFKKFQEFVRKHRVTLHDVYYHDWAIYAVFRAWGVRWVFDDNASMIYRQHFGNDTGARGTFVAAKTRLMLIKSGWYRRQISAIASLLILANPTDERFQRWKELITLKRSIKRQLKIASVCIKGGRRSKIDNLTVILGLLLGWI